MHLINRYQCTLPFFFRICVLTKAVLGIWTQAEPYKVKDKKSSTVSTTPNTFGEKSKRYIYHNKRSLGGQDSPSWFLISGSKPACWTYICKKGIVYNTDGHEVFTEMRLVGMLHAGYLDCSTWEKSNPLTVYCSKFVNLCVPGGIRTQGYIHVKSLDPVPYPLHHRIHSTKSALLHLYILITGYSVYCTSFNSYW